MTTRNGKKAKLKLTVAQPDAQLSAQSFAAALPAAGSTSQLVVVQYEGGSRARLSYHEKNASGVWKQQLSCAAYVGKNGIGKTAEGDGKTPSGTYRLTQAFGILANPGTSLPYRLLDDWDYWCGDSASPHYNQLMNARTDGYTPSAADEHMRAMKGYYNYGVVLDYNAAREPGRGSAIFLHCTGGKKSTSGCIAIPQKQMIQLLKALRPGAMIAID